MPGRQLEQFRGDYPALLLCYRASRVVGTTLRWFSVERLRLAGYSPGPDPPSDTVRF